MGERLDIRADQARPGDRIRRGNYAIFSASTAMGTTYLNVGAGMTFTFPADAQLGITRPKRHPPADTVATGLLRKILGGMYTGRDGTGAITLDGEIQMADDESRLVAELLDSTPKDD